jgi:hypothetical protein
VSVCRNEAISALYPSDEIETLSSPPVADGFRC